MHTHSAQDQPVIGLPRADSCVSFPVIVAASKRLHRDDSVLDGVSLTGRGCNFKRKSRPMSQPEAPTVSGPESVVNQMGLAEAQAR